MYGQLGPYHQKSLRCLIDLQIMISSHLVYRYSYITIQSNDQLQYLQI